ncbi:MAG TPA: tellurite resistance TerB family protein [Polyangiaceae bacterium]
MPWATPEGSILRSAAGVYSSRPVHDEVTVPTGFDPQAAALFEAIVESAYLVATADGVLDDSEREAFAQVVSEACGGVVEERQLYNLLSDLRDQVAEDGLDKRLAGLTRTVKKPEQQREVLRIAGLMAHVSGGVSNAEHALLDRLATSFELDATEVDAALRAVKSALA